LHTTKKFYNHLTKDKKLIKNKKEKKEKINNFLLASY